MQLRTLRRHGQRGASMIEVLVSIVIVTLGVISMAGLITTATRLSKASEMRAIASLMAADIADRMRANVCGVTGMYVYQPVPAAAGTTHCNGVPAANSYQLTTAFSVLNAAPPDAATNCSGHTVSCTPAQMAAFDLAQWRQALYFGLPNGMGYISYDAGAVGAGGAVDVWVTWLDPTALSTDEFADLDNGNAKLCPPGFRGVNPQPRCMYFRVAL